MYKINDGYPNHLLTSNSNRLLGRETSDVEDDSADVVMIVVLLTNSILYLRSFLLTVHIRVMGGSIVYEGLRIDLGYFSFHTLKTPD